MAVLRPVSLQECKGQFTFTLTLFSFLRYCPEIKTLKLNISILLVGV